MHGTNGIKSQLARKAVLVSLNVSMWGARKYDRKVTKEVNRSRHASDDAGRYNKLLIEKGRLAPVLAVVTEARDLFYKYTRPWAKGVGILPNVSYAEFSNKMRVLKQRYGEVADVFAKEFPTYVAERKRKLSEIYDPKDYPSEREIRGKFSFDVNFDVVPDVGDFRSDGIDEDTLNDIRAEIAESEKRIERDAIAHTYGEIADVVRKMAEKLGEYKVEKGKHFKDTLVDNIRELAVLLPTFNLTDDPKLEEITKRLQKELCIEDAKTLRDSDDVRASVKKSAEEILAEVEKHMA